MVQQSWMSLAAMTLSLLTLRFVHGLPFSALTEGFGHWRVLVLLFSYVASGLTTALMVKKLGAIAKSLCVPIYLGFCYAYAVYTGSASNLDFRERCARAARALESRPASESHVDRG